MPRSSDPVDNALDSLRSRAWPSNRHNSQLEMQLMRAFNHRRQVLFGYHHRVLLPVLAVLLVGSIGFAAAGGVEWIQSWFVTVTVDGTTVGTHEVPLSLEGTAEFDVELGELGEGPHVVELDIEGDGYNPDGAKQINVTLDGTSGRVRIEQKE